MKQNFQCFIGFTKDTNLQTIKKDVDSISGFLVWYFEGNLQTKSFKADSIEEIKIYLTPFDSISFLKLIHLESGKEESLLLKPMQGKEIYLVNPLERDNPLIFPN